MTDQNDHDLLVELRVEMLGVRSDIKEIKDGTTMRIVGLECDKADRREVEIIQKKIDDDIKVRIEALEQSKSTYFTMMVIYTGVGVSMIGLILYHIFQSK